MKWFKTEVDLIDHPKRYALEEALGTEYGLHYITLWFAYVAKYYTDGDVTEMNHRQVARSCEWNGDPDVFISALSLAGFLDISKGGNGGKRIIAHNWYQKNRRFIEENQKRKPLGNPRKTQEKPVLEENRIEEKRRESYTPEFDEFWNTTNRKGSKHKASQSWEKMTEAEASTAHEAYPKHKAMWETEETARKFQPDVVTWLNQKRWENELNVAIVKTVCAHVKANKKRDVPGGELWLCEDCGKHFTKAVNNDL